MEIKKIFFLLLLAVSTTAQKCDFLEGSIGNNYPIGNAKKQKQNLSDIITIRDLGMVKTDCYGLVSHEGIKDILKRKYPALNTDDIEVKSSLYYGTVLISSTFSGSYTGGILLTYTTKQKQKLSDIITIKDLGMVKAGCYGFVASEDIKDILKKKYPTLNTEHIHVFLYTYGSGSLCISSTASGNYTGDVLLTYTTKQKEQKQKLTDIIKISHLEITNNDNQIERISAYEIKNILKGEYPELNTSHIEVSVDFYYGYILVTISSTSSGNYTGNIVFTCTIKQKQNSRFDNSDKNFGNSSSKKNNFKDSKQNNKNSSNSSSECRTCKHNDKAKINKFYKTLNDLLNENEITDLGKINDNSSIKQLNQVFRRLCAIYHSGSTKLGKKEDDNKTKAITESRTLIEEHFRECQRKT
ncbi:hypothetical protein ACRRVD_02525 [Candidatus Cardinium hertigii]|uniref:hypothetical protein n=1 Tax=Candidatus Cardinium hertigii TaxID=247481 RepID=UPI003D7E80ED